MISLHLTIMALCNVFVVSAILYLATFTTNLEASSLVGAQQSVAAQIVSPQQQQQQQQQYNVKQAAPSMQQAAIQSPPPQDTIKPIQQAGPASIEEPVDQFKKIENDSPLSGKSSSSIETKSKVVETVEMKQQKEQPPSVKYEAPLVVGKSAEPQAEAPAIIVKELSSISAQMSPIVVDSQPIVSKSEEKASLVVQKSPKMSTENNVEHDSKLVAIQSPAVQYQAPKIEQSNDKQAVESKKMESSKIEQLISGKNVAPEIVDQYNAKAVETIPQAAALVAEPIEGFVVSGKSERKDYEIKPIVVVVKDEIPIKVASSDDIKLAAPKLERKLDESEKQAKVASEIESSKSVEVLQKKAIVAEISSEIVAKKVQNSVPSIFVAPAVKGGLGPLQLLATTLCSYQPDKQVADECLNQLYSRRANLRKSLLEFMSLKFTNLEKLSSRLGSGLQVVPLKTVGDQSISSHSSQPAPSHGWPVVGKCTAHDLKLMGEAAWCEGEPANVAAAAAAASQSDITTTNNSKNVDNNIAPVAGNNIQAVQETEFASRITSNQHITSRAQAARSIGKPVSSLSFLPSPEQSSVISKLLHVGDIKDAPVVESTIYNLNLTQQQLASLEAQATSTRECRRNALRYTKALFNHLAEDQRNISDTWPHLYALINADDCARKRMIDIVTALSGFRTDTTSIRRDNLEFAFAMDDLRTKVLDNEVNVPLTFDKQFIEVEQFLQQSVRLMLSNIDPNRAKLTSMRYRSLMYGTNTSSDDQCIELHQRLLAQTYPTDCNPNQFGQLPDVLRMTASSLELWSIEKEISLRTGRAVDYPNSDLIGHQQKMREDVSECIANLVSS